VFYYLKGNITFKGENFVAVDVAGAGYKVFTSVNNLSRINLNEVYTMYTYANIKEDTFDIYGFLSQEELSFFEMLISVSGVGPKAALSILSLLSPSDIVSAIIMGDSKAISRAPGVGTKIAQRIILELKNKVSENDILSPGGDDFLSIDTSNQAVAALMSLGYSATDAKRAVISVEGASSVEDTIKLALKNLM